MSEICWNCSHLDGKNPVERRCKAFPDKIPLEIWESKRNHDEPYPNDNGIRFEHFKSKSITSQNIIDNIAAIDNHLNLKRADDMFDCDK